MNKEYFGVGSIQKLGDILHEVRPQKILLVRGQRSFHSSGVANIIQKIISSYAVCEFYDFSSNPRIEDIERGIALVQKERPDIIVAVGGGSVMDMAKIINVLAVQKEPITMRGMPLVAIPTTAGTGSEVTQFAAFYIDKTKHSLDHPYVRPDYAIVDPMLAYTLPPRITASTGMDALSQAIESYWNIYATDESKKYAREAIVLAHNHLKDAVQNPSSKSREAMARAAYLAGKAINITRTTACHAVSYPMTAHFGIPHGHAVALTLGSMFEYNSKEPKAQKTMQELEHLLGVQSTYHARAKIETLMDNIGLERHLYKLGVDVEVVVKNGFNPERVKNNPRVLTESALRSMLRDLA